MTEQEWSESADPWKMLEFLKGRAGDRKSRLFAVARSCPSRSNTLEENRP